MKELLRKLDLLEIDGYRFLKQLAGGNMASSAIYRGKKNELVVIKFLFMPRNDDEYLRFKNEADTLLRLNDHAYAKFFVRAKKGITKIDSYPIYYFIMEYVEGKTLYELFKQNPLPWAYQKAVRIVLLTTLALEPALAAGIVHRDLHPGNIIVNRKLRKGWCLKPDCDPGVRILDFGISKDWFMGAIGEWEENEFRHVGAVSCWSPEYLISPGSVGPPHDIWALGSLLFRILTNNYAFHADNFGRYMEIITKGLYSREYLEQQNVPTFIKHLINRTLEVDPPKRIGFGGLVKMLRDFLADQEIQSKLDDDPELRKLYLEYDGIVGRCPRCEQLTPILTIRCSRCGTYTDEYLSCFFHFQ